MREADTGKETVHVIEKPGRPQKQLGLKPDDTVKYYLDIWDTRSEKIPFVQHSDGWYNHETKSDMVPVSLDCQYAPKPGTFICTRPGAFDHDDSHEPEKFWEKKNKNPNLQVIFYLFHNAGDPDSFDKYQLLAAMNYAHCMQIRMDACYVRGHDDRYAKDNGLLLLSDLWDRVAKDGWEPCV